MGPVALPLADVITPDPFTSAVITALGFLLVVRFLDVWEREPLWLVIVLALWGAVGATAIAAPGNDAVFGMLSPEVEVVWGPAISAPIVEELAKGAALVVVLVVSRRIRDPSGRLEFDGPVDGIVYGAAIGLGFAFAENNFYFLQQGDLEAGYDVLQFREGFLNLNVLGHAVYTGAFGAGLGLATWTHDRVDQVGFSLLGLGVAMFMHATHNGILSLMLVREYGLDATAIALAGGGLPADLIEQMTRTGAAAETARQVLDYAFTAGLFVILFLGVRYQRKVLAFELFEEVNRGLITREEWELVTRYGRRLALYTRLLASGHLTRWRALRAAHNELAGLAFLKWRTRRLGGDPSEIERFREQFAHLKAQPAYGG